MSNNELFNIAFRYYFEELYGENLQIANWHMNGQLEPLNNFINGAREYAMDCVAKGELIL